MSKVFCIGFGKTGTTSIGSFLGDLGFKLGDQAAGEMLLRDWAAGNVRPIIDLACTADAFQDIPFSLPGAYADLDRAFPSARFILTVRDDADQWYGSLLRFHTRIVGKGRVPTADELRQFGYRYTGWIFEVMTAGYGAPSNDPYDKRILTGAYADHIAAVTSHFRDRPSDLLTVNLAQEGAASAIIRFLKLPFDDQRLPHLNRTV